MAHNFYGNISFIVIIIYLFMLKKKNAHYAGILLDARTIALRPKLCRRFVSNPTLPWSG